MTTRLRDDLEARRTTGGVVDFVWRIYDRDRDADGSVVASAVALRVFLFFIPLVLVLVAGLGFLSSYLSASDASKQVGVTGGFAVQINNALHQSSKARWIALFSGLFGTAWAGRSLTSVLSAGSRRSWRLPTRAKSGSAVRVTGSVAGMLAAIGVLAIVVNRVRSAIGLVGGSMTIVSAAIAYALGWFIVTVSLPRARSDRSVLLPGAVFVGAGLAVTQWILQFEVPGKVSKASQLYGAIGIVIVALSWFFIVGRLFVASFTINAVVYERFGSLTTWLLRWRRLRRTVEHHPKLEHFLLAGGEARTPEEGEVDLRGADDTSMQRAPGVEKEVGRR